MKLYIIKKSKIDNKGRGLYAARDIKKGTKIINYVGKIITNKQVDNSNKFDIPLLAEEFIRSGHDFNITGIKTVDIQNIFHKIEKRTLEAAYKFYCQKTLDNAHSAEADTNATYEILIAQIEKYDELENNIDFLSEFSNRRGKLADLAGFIRYNEKNEKIFSFGKYKNKSLISIWKENPGYFSWFIQANFPKFTQAIIKDFINEIKLKDKFN